MNEATQKRLADKNGLTNELYVQEVRKEVRKQFDPSDETAILRKAVAILFLHPEELNNSEFMEYNAIVEEIKAEFMEYNTIVEEIKARCKEVKK